MQLVLEPEEAAPDAAQEAHVLGRQPTELTRIYLEGVNLCVWRRGLSKPLSRWLNDLCGQYSLHVVMRMDAARIDLRPALAELPDTEERAAWIEDLHLLLRMYVDLFEARWLGVRLTTLERGMCPRFHVDRVGVRLLCTYAGPATEWLRNTDAARAGLGAAGEAQRPGARVQRLERFDVVLLKGEAWSGNEGNGIIHRSPAVPEGQRRIVLSIDAVD